MRTKPFEESDRYLYPLCPDSVVLDFGGYEGTFAAGIFQRYGCMVHLFEPVTKFYCDLARRFATNPRVALHKCGIGARSCVARFSIKGDMTGQWADNPESEEVSLLSPEEIFTMLGLKRVDLMKLNIEGSEFDVLDRLIETGLVSRMEHIQVQWHSVIQNAQERFDALQASLKNTHSLEWDHGWVWQSWRKNEP